MKFPQIVSASLIVFSLPFGPAQAQTASTPLTVTGNATPASAVLPPIAIPSTTPTSADVPDDYRLDTDDSVAIDVTRHTDVTRTIRIPTDGMIRLPRLLTPIMARGKTVPELVSEITGKLVTEGKLVLRPGQVNVSVVGMRTRRIFVRGSATRSGDFDLRNDWRVADLIALVGMGEQADRITAYITNPKRPEPVKVNLNDALNKIGSPENVLLKEGDTLVLDKPGVKRLLVKDQGPRGMQSIDERFGLRRALLSLGFSVIGAVGDLKRATLIRNTVPGDFSSPETRIPVDLLALLTNPSMPDIPFQDQDTLDIPLSDKYIYIHGEFSGQHKYYLPQDRPTYLLDLVSEVGGTTGIARIGDITIHRKVASTGKMTTKTYDLGEYLKKPSEKNNPEIMPGDLVVVPRLKRTDVVGNIWTGFGLFNLFKTFIPGIR